MYFMYVDESGDPGVNNSPTNHFILSGIVVHEANWQIVLDRLKAFRRLMRQRYHLESHDEIHAGPMISSSSYHNIQRHNRLAILRELARELASMNKQISIINVHVDKRNPSIIQHSDPKKKPSDLVFEYAWSNLIQRYSNTLSTPNFPGPRSTNERFDICR